MAIGWVRVSTQRGVIITGRRSTSARTISNEVLPEPITIDARSSRVGTPEAASVAPTSCRLARCADRSGPDPRPPRYTMRRTPAARAAAPKARAPSRSAAR